jgi:hypothetical protein
MMMIACGVEIANIFIFALTQYVFARFGDYILNHDHYIDDGFTVWTGTTDRYLGASRWRA